MAQMTEGMYCAFEEDGGRVVVTVRFNWASHTHSLVEIPDRSGGESGSDDDNTTVCIFCETASKLLQNQKNHPRTCKCYHCVKAR